MDKKVAVYVRVSKEEMHPENQIRQLKKFIVLNKWTIFKIYTDKITGRVTDRPQFQQMLRDARMRKFNILLVWSLDRFSREGIRNNLNYLERLKKYDVGFKSYQEPLIDTTQEGVGEIIIAILSWVAKREAQRISERTKAGLERAKAKGKQLGRPKGSKDRHKRQVVNYYKRWEK